MRAIEIRKHVRKEPFRPFRVFLSNGIHYDVRHSELMYVGRTEVVIAKQLGVDDLPVEFAYCDPIHNIEPLKNSRSKKTSDGEMVANNFPAGTRILYAFTA